MSRITKYYSAVLLIFSLVTKGSALAQELAKDSLTKIIEQGNDRREMIYLHTAGSVFLSTDTIWFTAYVIDRQTSRPSRLSEVAYAALRDPAGRLLKQVRFSLSAGKGEAYLALDSNYLTGYYSLIPYTHLAQPDSLATAANDLLILQPNTAHFYGSAPTEAGPIEAAIFPEGGSWVDGLESTLAVQVSAAEVDAPSFHGWLLRNKADTLSKLNFNSNGIALFQLKPAAGERYSVRVELPDTSLSVAVPAPNASGIVMHLHQLNEKWNLAIQTSPNLDRQPFYLLLYAKGKTSAIYRIAIRDRQANFSIESNLLAAGINHLLIVDGEGNPRAERLLFNQPASLKNLQVSIKDSLAHTRQRLSAILQLNDPKGQISNARVSAAIYRIDALQDAPAAALPLSLYLNSELNGPVREPALYFDENLPHRDERLEALLLTQTASGLQDRHIHSVDSNLHPEDSSRVLVIKSIAQASTTSRPVLWTPGAEKPPLYARKLSGDRIGFFSSTTYEDQRAFLQMPVDKNYQLDKPFQLPQLQKRTASQPWNLPENAQAALLYRLINADAMKLFTRPVTAQAKTREKPLRFYGKPDVAYKLDDYTRFPVMEEVLREIVAELRIRKEGNDFIFRLFDTRRKQFFENPPLVLYDGIPVQQLQHLMDVNPKSVQQIDLVLKKWISGHESYDGIINFTTYKQDLSGIVLDSSLIKVSLNGLQEKRQFHPDLANAGRRPLFTEILNWIPDLKLDGNPTEIEWMTNDLKGLFLVDVQGFDEEGRPVWGQALFRVD